MVRTFDLVCDCSNECISSRLMQDTQAVQEQTTAMQATASHLLVAEASAAVPTSGFLGR